MTAGVQSLDWLRNLGSVAEIQEAATHGAATKVNANAHVHLPPNFSAFANVREAVGLAQEQGITVLGPSNYYDYAVYEEFAAQARAAGIFPLFGIEIIALIEALVCDGTRINDPGNPGRIYLCGKGITRFSEPPDWAARQLHGMRQRDGQRMAEIVAKLEALFSRHGIATGLSDRAIIERVVVRSGASRTSVCLQERHVCQAFQQRLFEIVPPPRRSGFLAQLFGEPLKASPEDAVGVQDEIRSRLVKAGRPAFVPETFGSFESARRLILELGGIPSYPVLADGAKPICPFEEPVEALAARLSSMGVHAAELIPVRNSPEVLTRYVNALRSAGLVVTGGTEHNTPELLPLELRCAKGVPIPAGVQAIFREGACVVAAHQFLTLQGQCGYVDSAGIPNPAYANAEERIAAFRRLGAAVIARFQEANSHRT